MHNHLTWIDTLGLESYPKDDKALSYDEESGQWVDNRTEKPTTDRTYERPSSHNWSNEKPRVRGAKPNSVCTY